MNSKRLLLLAISTLLLVFCQSCNSTQPRFLTDTDRVYQVEKQADNSYKIVKISQTEDEDFEKLVEQAPEKMHMLPEGTFYKLVKEKLKGD